MTALACPARAEHGDRFVDTPLASLGRLDTLNREHMPLLLAVRQPVEELAGLCIPGESRRKGLRHDYSTRLCIEFDGDFNWSPAATPALSRCFALTGSMNLPPMNATVLR